MQKLKTNKSFGDFFFKFVKWQLIAFFKASQTYSKFIRIWEVWKGTYASLYNPFHWDGVKITCKYKPKTLKFK